MFSRLSAYILPLLQGHEYSPVRACVCACACVSVRVRVRVCLCECVTSMRQAQRSRVSRPGRHWHVWRRHLIARDQRGSRW